jgi:ArsR family metal-binding transcriptional regulator
VPNIPEILKWLPQTNCRQCYEPTCLIFATRLAEGVKSPGDCPELSLKHRQNLEAYLRGFQFEDSLLEQKIFLSFYTPALRLR